MSIKTISEDSNGRRRDDVLWKIGTCTNTRDAANGNDVDSDWSIGRDTERRFLTELHASAQRYLPDVGTHRHVWVDKNSYGLGPQRTASRSQFTDSERNLCMAVGEVDDL